MKFRHLLLLIALIVPMLICSNALFAQPLVTGVAPNRGSTGGRTLVTITGSDFSDAAAVTFGGRAAQSFTVVNSSTIQAQAPVGTIGAAQVAVASASGVSPANSPDDLFVYVGVWFAYETTADDGTVTVINIANNTARFTIPMGTSPMASQSLLMPKPHMSSISAIRFQLVDGRLIFKGKHRLLAVNGLTLVDVGIVKASAHGAHGVIHDIEILLKNPLQLI